jgi:hypothetical protein
MEQEPIFEGRLRVNLDATWRQSNLHHLLVVTPQVTGYERCRLKMSCNSSQSGTSLDETRASVG